MEYVYIIRNPIYKGLYKVGKTRFPIKRLSTYDREYDKGFHYLVLLECSKCDSLERKLLKRFNRRFERAEKSLEWFSGNFCDIVRCFFSVCGVCCEEDGNVKDVICFKKHRKYKYLLFKVILNDGTYCWKRLQSLGRVCGKVKKAYERQIKL